MVSGHEAAIDAGAHERKRGTSMKLFGRHATQARCFRPCRRHVIPFAIAVAVVALAWLSFNALVRFVTLD